MTKPIAARIYQGTPRNLAMLAAQLRRGELVGVPTETVYGLAANALDARACRRIFTAKRRPATDPLIVHLWSPRELDTVCVPNAAALRLAAAFWPGPLTLVLPKQEVIPGVVTAGRESVAVRVPSHALFRRLLKIAGIPLAAPSANPFGYVSPTTAEHVRHGLGSRIRFILDGGECPIGLESTIVDLRDETKPRLLRPGAVTRAELEGVLRRPLEVTARKVAATESRGQVAPGMLTRHYSPRTPVSLERSLAIADVRVQPETAFVFFRKPKVATGRNIFWLDAHGDLRAAARALFATLRRLDRAGFARIRIECAPGDGLADAINDRLRRAAAR